MKHWLRLALCGGALAALLTCGAAAATDDYTTNAAGTVTYSEETGKYTASYNGTTSGNQYAILVVKGTYENGVKDYSISEDTIMYIDQMAADRSGVSFDFIPRSTPDCVVLLGGEFSDGQSPVVLGTLVGKGVTVSGSVELQGRTNHSGATVALTGEGGASLTATTGSDGSFTIDSVPVGTYELKITMPGYLSYTKKSFAVEEETKIEAKSLQGGDIEIDGQVTVRDLTSLLREYGNEAGSTNNANDINGDAQITVRDLSILLGNYGMSAIEE